MGKAYHIDLRERVIEYTKLGNSYEKASEVFGIGKNTVYRWVQRSRKNILEYRPKERNFKKINPTKLKEYVFNNNGLTIKEYAKEFNVAPFSIFNAFRKLGITRKKKKSVTKNGMKKSVGYFLKN